MTVTAQSFINISTQPTVNYRTRLISRPVRETTRELLISVSVIQAQETLVRNVVPNRHSLPLLYVVNVVIHNLWINSFSKLLRVM